MTMIDYVCYMAASKQQREFIGMVVNGAVMGCVWLCQLKGGASMVMDVIELS